MHPTGKRGQLKIKYNSQISKVEGEERAVYSQERLNS